MKDEWRGGQCLIGPDNGWPIGEAAGERNFVSCTEEGDRPLLVLWGDSFAAHLYPGIKHKQTTDNYRIAQYTLNACPPVLDLDIPHREYCSTYQRILVKKIIELKPAYLVMAGAWVEPMATYEKLLSPTIAEIQYRSPLTRVTLVGSPAQWKEPLPQLLQRLSLVKNGQFVTIPDIRLRDATSTSDFRNDTELANLAASVKVSYFSLSDVFCDENGCLTRVGRDFQNLFSMDRAHLTPIASDLAASELIPQVISGDRVLGSKR
jgi:hypothetical protein